MNDLNQAIRPQVLGFLLFAFCSPLAEGQLLQGAQTWDEDQAIQHSQAVVGRPIGEYELTDSSGNLVTISRFRGKPLLVSMIFTSCHHVCPTTTKRLSSAVQAAGDVLGQDSFNVLSIGFDTRNDTPGAMATFARQQGIDRENWYFLGGDFGQIDALAEDLGFIYYETPRGFDHITQVSVIDRDGLVYRQVYGMNFELPWLVEPLKDLVFNRHGEAPNFVASLMGRIRLFCTVYDPARDRYHFDYSLFVQMIIGFLAIAGVMVFLVRGLRGGRMA